MNKHLELYKLCFPEDSDALSRYMFESVLGEDNSLVKYDGKTLACAMYLVDKTLYYKGHTYTLPYIVGLGTAPAYRNLGYSKELIVKCLDKLCAENVPFVALYPFKHSFYQKFDFFTPSFDYTLEGEKVKCEIDDTRIMYENFCKGLDYYIVRNDTYYDFIKGIIKIENSSYNKVLKDGTKIGYSGNDEVLPLHYYKGEKEGVMVRIANARCALSLSKLTFDKKIRISDSLVANNNFSCQLTGGKVIETNDYDITIDIATLGEVIFGKKTLDGKNLDTLKGYLSDRY